MRREGIKPDKVTLNTAIAAVGAGGQWETAMSIMGEMKAAGLSPDAVRYVRGALLRRKKKLDSRAQPDALTDYGIKCWISRRNFPMH